MSAQVFKLKKSSICLSILLLCLFFTVISARGLSHKFVLAVERDPEIHEAEAGRVEETHEEIEHEEEHVVVEHEEETHEDAEHETIGHGEAEGEEGEDIVIPPVVDAAFPVVIVVLLLGAGKILEGYGKKTV